MTDTVSSYLPALFGDSTTAAASALPAGIGLSDPAAMAAIGGTGGALPGFGAGMAAGFDPTTAAAGLPGMATSFAGMPGGLNLSGWGGDPRGAAYAPVGVPTSPGSPQSAAVSYGSAVPQIPSGGAAGGTSAGPGLSSSAISAPQGVGLSGAQVGDFSGSSSAQPSSVGGTSSANIGGATTPPTPDKGVPNSILSAWNDPSSGNIMKAVGNNIGPLISGAGLGAAALRGNQTMPGQNQISATAAQLGAQGQTLQNYLTSGTLPPGVAESLHSAGEAAKASIRSQYAARGMTGSDAEMRDLASVDTGIVTQGASIASNLLSQGIQESNLSAQLYNTIMGAAVQQDAQLGQAISHFASSMVPQQQITLKTG